MRVVDVMLSLPILFVILVVANFMGQGEARAPDRRHLRDLQLDGVSRLVRASSRRSANASSWAARAVGVRDRRIIFRHILPNAMSPIVVAASLIVGADIIAEAFISFLGGVDPTQRPGATSSRTPGRSSPRATGGGRSSRGRDHRDGADGQLRGDGLRDAFDPRSRA